MLPREICQRNLIDRILHKKFVVQRMGCGEVLERQSNLALKLEIESGLNLESNLSLLLEGNFLSPISALPLLEADGIRNDKPDEAADHPEQLIPVRPFRLTLLVQAIMNRGQEFCRSKSVRHIPASFQPVRKHPAKVWVDPVQQLLPAGFVTTLPAV